MIDIGTFFIWRISERSIECAKIPFYMEKILAIMRMFMCRKYMDNRHSMQSLSSTQLNSTFYNAIHKILNEFQ